MKTSFLKMTMCSVLLAASILSGAFSIRGEKDVIISRNGNTSHTGIPKGPVPISCSVDDESGELNVYFTGNLGNVAITVCELSLGIVASETVDSSLGTVQLYIPVTPGFYEITFVTAGGDIYTGTFTL